MRVSHYLLCCLAKMSPASAETIRLYAAGSLKAAMTDIASAFETSTKGAHKIDLFFGASGLLRESIEACEMAHVFASADTGHRKRLESQGKSSRPVTVFARNQLCVLVREGVTATSSTLLDVLLDPDVRVGTSTPKADPSGDYAFALFAKADAVRSGSKAKLDAIALQLTGGTSSVKAPEGKNLYAGVMSSNKADVFLTYCTNAVRAKAELPSLSIVDTPSALNVGADYGLVILKGAPAGRDRAGDLHPRDRRSLGAGQIWLRGRRLTQCFIHCRPRSTATVQLGQDGQSNGEKIVW